MRKTYVPLLVLMIAFLAAFSPALFGNAMLDDAALMSAHAGLPFAEAVSRIMSQPMMIGEGSYWRPLTAMTFAFVGPSAVAQHAFNLLLGLLYVGGVWTLAGSLLPESIRSKGWVVAAVCAPFCLHPLISEPTDWISGRFDLLMTTLVVWALAAAARGKPVHTALLVFAALLSKDTALAFALGIPFIFWKGQDKKGSALLAAGCAAALLAWVAMRSQIGTVGASKMALFKAAWLSSPADAFMRFCDALGTYFSTFVFPWGFVEPNHASGDIAGASLIGVAVFAGLVFLGVRGLAKPRDVSAKALAVGSGYILVVAGLMAFDTNGFITGDRYLFPFLAMTALAAFASSLPEKVAAVVSQRRARSWWVFGCALLAAGSALSAAKWQDDVTLWQTTFDRHPSNVVASSRLAAAWMSRGRFDLADAPSAAAEEFWSEKDFSKRWVKDSGIVTLRSMLLIETDRPGRAVEVIRKWRGRGYDDQAWKGIETVGLAESGRCSEAAKARSEYFSTPAANPLIAGRIASAMGKCEGKKQNP
jgi:hypothetical protein